MRGARCEFEPEPRTPYPTPRTPHPEPRTDNQKKMNTPETIIKPKSVKIATDTHTGRRIVVVGTGYVGLSNAVLLAQHNEVIAVDIVPERVDMLNEKQSPIEDAEISKFLTEKKLDFRASLDTEMAYAEAEFVIVATPTDYNPEKIGRAHV